jgi:hypothetical protein
MKYDTRYRNTGLACFRRQVADKLNDNLTHDISFTDIYCVHFVLLPFRKRLEDSPLSYSHVNSNFIHHVTLTHAISE